MGSALAISDTRILREMVRKGVKDMLAQIIKLLLTITLLVIALKI